MRQSKRDLETAKDLLQSGKYEWSCFISQQAAEKAVKALLQKQGLNSWGHSIVKLLEQLANNSGKFDDIDQLSKYGKYLDKLYIQTRYPNGFSEGTPGDYYTEEDANKAIAHVENILNFVMKGFGGNSDDPRDR